MSMSMDKVRIRHFFKEVVMAGLRYPGRPGFGSPISYLIDKIFTHDVEGLVNQIMGDYTDESHEWRLNGAGLKLNWHVVKTQTTCSGVIRRFTCSLGGDQKVDYPEFALTVDKLIHVMGFEKNRAIRWRNIE